MVNARSCRGALCVKPFSVAMHTLSRRELEV